ncbi:MAG: hypothetical protein U1E52_02075 [Geminicoccaceae bacterium]
MFLIDECRDSRLGRRRRYGWLSLPEELTMLPGAITVLTTRVGAGGG